MDSCIRSTRASVDAEEDSVTRACVITAYAFITQTSSASVIVSVTEMTCSAATLLVSTNYDTIHHDTVGE